MYLELKSADEIRSLEEAARAAREVLLKTRKELRPGITTKRVEEIAVAEIKALGAEPAFLNYRGYPASICVSVNEELVHGIPSERRVIRSGDLVKLDIGVRYNGFYGDVAETIPIGKADADARKLLEVTYGCLGEMLKHAAPGKRMGDMGAAVQRYVENNGFSVIRQFVGHGIGRRLHEKPEVPNFGERDTGQRFEEGMVLALEPMVACGDWHVKIAGDGWTASMADAKLCAHFEKMIAVCGKNPVFLADFEPIFKTI
jgi:methionyl aminopeptidase